MMKGERGMRKILIFLETKSFKKNAILLLLRIQKENEF